MSRFQLLLRNLLYFRYANAAVVAGMAVACAVLTGALMVGDSVRASLRELALRRLGPVDDALVSTRFFNADLAQRVAASPDFSQKFEACVPGILLQGGASSEQSNLRTGGVQVAAVGGEWVPVDQGKTVINRWIARELGLKPESPLNLSLPLVDETPKDAALARRGREDTTLGMRVVVDRDAGDAGFAAEFSLTGGQRLTRNVWVNLAELQSQLDQPGRANALLVKSKSQGTSTDAANSLQQILKTVARLDDYGLKLDFNASKTEAILNSTSTYILPAVDAAAAQAASELGTKTHRVSVYLINHVMKVDQAGQPGPTIHYAIAAGLDGYEVGPALPDNANGASAGPTLRDDQIAVNEWAARQLDLHPGDHLRLDYYKRQSNGELQEVRSDQYAGLLFTVVRILPMTGLGADPSLTPVYKGLTDKESVRDWKAPVGLEIDTSKADEEYWKKYKASPQLFVSLPAARKLWGNAYGDINSLRIPADKAQVFAQSLVRHIDPAGIGMAFVPIKAQQVAAASGSTDFSGLFIGFSFFLIAAAAILVAMLFRLSVEQRARQFGLLGAVGFSPSDLRKLALIEGMLLGAVGSALGLLAAIGYTWLMVAGLRTWWVGAVGTTALRLEVSPMTLATGFAISLLVAAGAVAFAVWRLGKAQASALLAGGWQIESTAHNQHRVSRTVAAVSLLGGLAMIATGVSGKLDAQAAYLGGGTLLLIGGLSLLAAMLGTQRRSTRTLSVALLGFRNAGRHRGRSIMTMGLIAFASFVLVTVSAFKQRPPTDTRKRDSGTGGFQMILQADVPLLGDLNTAKGRRVLGVRDISPIWKSTRFVSMRSWKGQDISCLNLTRPSSPTILAVPQGMQGRFSFAKSIHSTNDPWSLLEESGQEIPVITDNETASYILKLGIGDTFPLVDQLGRTQTLKLVATLQHSIFQSEMLMGEKNFARLFPSQSGFGAVLIETASDAENAEVKRVLGEELEDYSVTVESTAARLARYQEVANTYLSTFQTLGSLGLLLGTIGLAVILLRGLVERRSELALLGALGFNQAKRVKLVLAENLFLLIAGLAVGAISAGIGIWPAVRTSAGNINVPQLTLTLAIVLITGIVVLVIAVGIGGRRMKVADLRAE